MGESRDMMDVVPRWLVLLADWSNVIAGLILIVAFALVVLLSYGFATPAQVIDAINTTFFLEGVFWAIAAAALVKVNLIENNAALAVSQTIICFGGIFFALSGLGGVPGNVISINYVVPLDEHAHLVDACPFYGITCFMVATSMGLSGVWGLPKKKIVSPFWAVACFFIGAWTIGIFGFWGPCLAGGLAKYEDVGVKKFAMPTFAWAWVHVFQLVGACFLTVGGIIFGLMDNFLAWSVDDKEFSTDNDSDGGSSHFDNAL